MARLVVPGYPHHVTQRGARRMATFFGPEDYAAYRGLLRVWCAKAGTEVWAYCLMPNHVHLILVPGTAGGLRAALGEAHRRYTRRVNLREGWRGHLWQERFHSFVMDEDHLLACARYVELNPVRAGVVARPEDWPWSSAKAHLAGGGDATVAAEALLGRVADWRGFLDGGLDAAALETLRRHGRSGHALGSEAFLAALARTLGREVRPRRPGRPRKAATAGRSG